MSDRIAAMNKGRVDQVRTPREVYEDPATLFVADFLGVANAMEVEARAGDNGSCAVRGGEAGMIDRTVFVGSNLQVMVRPPPGRCCRPRSPTTL